MSELVVLATTWISEISYRSGYVGLLVLHLLLLLIKTLAYCRNVVRLSLFYIDITLVYVHLNWLCWFCFLILVGGPVVILIESIVFLSFLDVIRMFIPAAYFSHSQTSKLFACKRFLFIYDLNGFKSTIKTVKLFKRPPL